jgi:hypothetical protein
MPFVTVSRRMAEQRAARRRTRQQFEIESLTGQFAAGQESARNQFQSQQASILGQYQSQISDYTQRMSQYEQAAQEFQRRSDEYNAAVDRFNTITRLPGEFVATPKSGLPATYVSANIPSSNFGSNVNFLTSGALGQALAGQPGVSTQVWAMDKQARISGVDIAQLPSQFVVQQVGSSPAGYPKFSIAQRAGADPGEFNAAMPEAVGPAPSAPDFSQLSEEYQRSIAQQRDTVEREIGERRAASMRARRRMTDRPLLSGA